jgi:hypothetical protein
VGALDIDAMMRWGAIKPGAHLAGEIGFSFYDDQLDVKFESRVGDPWESWLRLIINMRWRITGLARSSRSTQDSKAAAPSALII